MHERRLQYPPPSGRHDVHISDCSAYMQSAAAATTTTYAPRASPTLTTLTTTPSTA